MRACAAAGKAKGLLIGHNVNGTKIFTMGSGPGNASVFETTYAKLGVSPQGGCFTELQISPVPTQLQARTPSLDPRLSFSRGGGVVSAA